jgi:hypothetical protein
MRRIAKTMRKREENYEDAATATNGPLPGEALGQFGDAADSRGAFFRGEGVDRLGQLSKQRLDRGRNSGRRFGQNGGAVDERFDDAGGEFLGRRIEWGTRLQHRDRLSVGYFDASRGKFFGRRIQRRHRF